MSEETKDTITVNFDELTLDQYQAQAMVTAVYRDPLYPVLGLAEEAGELAGKYAKALRGDKPLVQSDIAKELGDVLWMCAAVANEINLSLGMVGVINLNKLADRQARQVIQGDGDER